MVASASARLSVAPHILLLVALAALITSQSLEELQDLGISKVYFGPYHLPLIYPLIEQTLVRLDSE